MGVTIPPRGLEPNIRTGFRPELASRGFEILVSRAKTLANTRLIARVSLSGWTQVGLIKTSAVSSVSSQARRDCAASLPRIAALACRHCGSARLPFWLSPGLGSRARAKMRRACARALLRGTNTLDASAPRGWAGYGQCLERSMEGEVLTVQELARILRVNTSTIYRLLKRGGLPARVGSDRRFGPDRSRLG